MTTLAACGGGNWVVVKQVHLIDPQGAETDVINASGTADAGSYGNMADRFGLIGEQTGSATGRYLQTRIAGK